MTRGRAGAPAGGGMVAAVAGLQRLAGNRAVSRLVSAASGGAGAAAVGGAGAAAVGGAGHGGRPRTDAGFSRREFEEGAAAYAAGHYEVARRKFLASYLASTRQHQQAISFDLGQACRKGGRFAEAVDWYEEYLAAGRGDRREEAVSGLHEARTRAAAAAGDHVALPRGGPDNAAAEAGFRLGTAAYDAGDYEAARAHFLAAYASAGPAHQANLAFDLGQACRKGGRPTEAISYYKEYLETGDGRRRADCEDGIKDCRDAVAASEPDPVERPPAVTAGQPGVERPTVREGSSGDDVVHLQRRLNTLGLGSPAPEPPVDGIFGPRTFARVVLAQEVLALAVDGVVGRHTWGRLEGQSAKLSVPGGSGPRRPPPPGRRPVLRRGSRGRWVRALQSGLNGVVEVAGPAYAEDGDFGNRTRAGVILLEEARHLTVDGVAGQAVWATLGG